MAEEWFRRAEWTREVADEFERRLARTRPANRPQYLRIKALAVLRGGDPASAEMLLRRVLDEHPDSFEVRAAHEHLADLYVDVGRGEDAQELYRVILTRWPNQSGTTGEVPIKLAELLLAGGTNAVEEAARLLDGARPSLVLKPSVLRWGVVRARVAEAAGDRETARRDVVAPDSGDWERLRSALTDAGVGGAHDLGRFVSNTEWFEASTFDERAAMPVLIEMLPTLTEPSAVGAVAGHLRRPWARPAAFASLKEAFERWAERDESVGWALGDALGSAAGKSDGPAVLSLATDERYGTSRQMIVSALPRFKKEAGVEAAITLLIHDPDVALHAMGALRRLVGNERALPLLRRVRDEHADPRVRDQAASQIRKAEKAVRRR